MGFHKEISKKKLPKKCFLWGSKNIFLFGHKSFFCNFLAKITHFLGENIFLGKIFFSFFFCKHFWWDFFFGGEPKVEQEVNKPQVDPKGGGRGRAGRLSCWHLIEKHCLTLRFKYI